MKSRLIFAKVELSRLGYKSTLEVDLGSVWYQVGSVWRNKETPTSVCVNVYVYLFVCIYRYLRLLETAGPQCASPYARMCCILF